VVVMLLFQTVHPQAGVALQSAVGTSKVTRPDPINKTIVILLKPILQQKY
jgi:hypothetical protein